MQAISHIHKKIFALRAAERFSGRDTVVHRLHPLAKLIATAVYVTVVVSFGRYALGGLVVYLAYPSVLMALSETPPRHLFWRVLAVLPFSCIAGLSNVIFDTAIAVRVLGVDISFGAVSFIVIILKSFLAVSAVLVLVFTTRLCDLQAQLLRLKVSVVFVTVLAQAHRYLSVIAIEAQAMMSAYRLRSPKQKGIHIRHIAGLLGQLLIRSASRAQRVQSAMECRGGGFGFGEGHTAAPRRPFAAADWVYVTLVCGLAVLFRLYPAAQVLGGGLFFSF